MKKQRSILLSLCLLAFLFVFTPGNLFSADTEDSTNGHISYVDKEAAVIRQDQTKHAAVVNLPVVPGDQIVTGENGRCELQFDNGTVIRLDKDSRLKITTVLAPALTSKWKITTLHLMRGKLYSMNQSYRREMFQIITPNAAIDLKKRSAATIHLDENGNTHIFADKGKFNVMYGGDAKSVKTETIRSGKGYTITADHNIRVGEVKRDIDFVGWNDYINRNFKDLHYGVSKIPKKIYRYNKAIVYWAEKWSSLVGEWVYDELLGYVWKPADEIFAVSSRPFFHADYVKINGKLHVVPQQPWGWAPSHLGTWVWMKWGWTWVPGNTFNNGIQYNMWNLFRFSGPNAYPYFFFPTLGNWIRNIYGSYDLYYTYRTYGEDSWSQAYRRKYNRENKRPLLKNVPQSVRELIKRLNNAPVKLIKERLGTHRPSGAIDINKIQPLFNSTIGTKPSISPSVKKLKSNKIRTRAVTVNPMTALRTSQAGKSKISKLKLGIKNFRDWNPDRRWATKNGFKISYSSESNAVVLPELNLNSRKLTNRQRMDLRGDRGLFSKRGSYSRGSGSSSGSSTGTTGSSTTSSKSSSSSGGSRSGVGTGSKTNDR